MLARVRRLINEADPEVVEDVKWRKPSNPAGVPVWSHDGIICTGETYKAVVKLTFAKGASLEDPAGLFNSSLEGNTRRAIDIHEGDKINEKALVALIRAAVALNSLLTSKGRLSSAAAKENGRPWGKSRPSLLTRVAGGGAYRAAVSSRRDIREDRYGVVCHHPAP